MFWVVLKQKGTTFHCPLPQPHLAEPFPDPPNLTMRCQGTPRLVLTLYTSSARALVYFSSPRRCKAVRGAAGCGQAR